MFRFIYRAINEANPTWHFSCDIRQFNTYEEAKTEMPDKTEWGLEYDIISIANHHIRS